jgi:hypothetical protein
MKEADLLSLKKRIDDAKTKTSELRGRKEYLEKELLEKWGCKNIAEAEKKSKKLSTEIEELSQQINDGMEEIEHLLKDEQ